MIARGHTAQHGSADSEAAAHSLWPCGLLLSKGTRSEPDLKVTMVHKGSINLLSLGTYLNCELPMRVRGTLKPGPSAHSCGGGSQPPRMTQLSMAPPCSPPTPPHQGGQVRSGGARPGPQGPLAGASKPKDSSGLVAPVQGIDQVPLPSLCSFKIAFLMTGQDKVGGEVPVPLGLSARNGKKALRPWRAGVGPLVYEKIPSTQPGGELYRCAVRAGSQPILLPGPSPEDKDSKGDSRTSQNRGAIARFGVRPRCKFGSAAWELC